MAVADSTTPASSTGNAPRAPPFAWPSMAPTPYGTHLDGSWSRWASSLPRAWISSKPRGSFSSPPVALEQPVDAALTGLGPLVLAVAAGAGIVPLVGLGLLVRRDVPLVVAQHDLVVGVADEVVGHDEGVSAAAPGASMTNVGTA